MTNTYTCSSEEFMQNKRMPVRIMETEQSMYEEIAQIIQPQFAETDLAQITTIVERYYDQDTWKSDLIFEKESFELLQDILDMAGELSKRAPYDDLVNTEYALKAAE